MDIICELCGHVQDVSSDDWDEFMHTPNGGLMRCAGCDEVHDSFMTSADYRMLLRTKLSKGIKLSESEWDAFRQWGQHPDITACCRMLNEAH